MNPGGGRYLLDTWPASKVPPFLIDWSGDKTRALFWVGHGGQLAQFTLATGKITSFALAGNAGVLGYTRPDGLNILAQYQDGLRTTFARYSVAGKLAKVIATVPANSGEAVYSADGTELAVRTNRGLDLLSNAGGVIRELPVPGADPSAGCMPARWWKTGVMVASCFETTSGNRLWLVPVTGGDAQMRDPAGNQADAAAVGTASEGAILGLKHSETTDVPGMPGQPATRLTVDLDQFRMRGSGSERESLVRVVAERPPGCRDRSTAGPNVSTRTVAEQVKQPPGPPRSLALLRGWAEPARPGWRPSGMRGFTSTRSRGPRQVALASVALGGAAVLALAGCAVVPAPSPGPANHPTAPGGTPSSTARVPGTSPTVVSTGHGGCPAAGGSAGTPQRHDLEARALLCGFAVPAGARPRRAVPWSQA